MPGVPKTCILGHDPAPTWVLRPALVGAGVSIEFVHFDRACQRGPHQARIEWRAIVGETKPQATDMTLTEWLAVNEATIDRPPEGPVATPDAGELRRLTAAVAGNRAQRRAKRKA